MQLSKWILVGAAVVVILFVGWSIFPPFHQMFNSFDISGLMPMAGSGMKSLSYIFFLAIPYAAYRIFKSRGQ